MQRKKISLDMLSFKCLSLGNSWVGDDFLNDN